MNCNRNPNMPMPFMRNLSTVDFGVDLGALQPEITECKRRFQQDVWNIICNKVLQGQGSSGWKKTDGEDTGGRNKKTKGTKTEEEEYEENANNANTKCKEASNDQQHTCGCPHLVRQSRPRDVAPVPIKRNPVSGGRRVNSVHGGYGGTGVPQPHKLSGPVARIEQPAGSNNDNSPLRHPQQSQQRRPPKRDAVRRPTCNGEWGKTEEPSRFVKQQSNPREQQRQSAAVSRGGAVHAACRARAFRQQHKQQQFPYSRSYSATSHREILGANSFEQESAATLDTNEFVDASEAAAVGPDARVPFYDEDTGCSLTLNGGYSQMFSGRRRPETDESSSYLTPRPAKNFEAGSAATRKFVPLIVGDWLAGNRRMKPRQIF